MKRTATILNAWLLHTRPFRDSSLLLDFLTLEQGRVSAIARGARSTRSKKRFALQSFVPLQIVLSGKGELQTLAGSEPAAPGLWLQGERLFAGMYLNELLVKLLPQHEAEPALFRVYADTLAALAGGNADLEPQLRMFELRLLESLGYGIALDVDAESGEAIEAQGWYHLEIDRGFVKRIGEKAPAGDEIIRLFPGHELLRIESGDFAAASTRQYAKRMLRQVLQSHLGGKTIASRTFFQNRLPEG